MDNELLTIERFLAPADRRAALLADARRGLTAPQKSVPPVWFYDERGSLLFDEITRLPEYYLTRAERSILVAHADAIVRSARADVLVELGSGTSEKTRLLLDAMAAAGSLRAFVPFDVSEEVLEAAATDITKAYGVSVTAVVGDFHRHLGRIPKDGRRMIAFLGSTIGNFTPAQREVFLSEVVATMAPGDTFLMGADLVKDVDRLVAAYDDAAGVTAEFNRNVLRVLDAELDANFDPDAFDHVARWNAADSWIEMRLRARHEQRVDVPALGLQLHFDGGEDLLTEISSKFTVGQVHRELGDAGLDVEHAWTDEPGDFLLVLAKLP